ncbi:MAG: fibronectin type III domain-containing protein, partial [Actinomycetes bacterium]
MSVDHGSVQDTIRVYFEQPVDLGAQPSGEREYQFLVCAASCGSAANWDVDPDATIAIDSVPSYPWVRNVTCAAETVCSVRMQLVDGAGHQSPLSPASTATGAILPSEPLNVAAITGSTSGTITVTWDAPGDAGFPAFDHYETSTSTDGGTTWGAWTSTGGTATSIDLACAPGVTCTVRVRAVSEIGAGPSASDSAVGAEVPGAPENVAVVTGTTSGTVDVDWDAPSNLGTPALTEYQTRYSIDAGVTFSAWSNTGSTATSRTITCGAGETCVVQVRAVNSIGTGSSASDSAVAADVPAQLTGFSATLSSGDAVLAWTLGASYPAITDIEYQVSTDGGT